MLLADFQYENSNQSKILNRELTKDFDINSLCRICMGEKPLMTSMFFKPQGESKFCIDTYRKVTEVSQCNVRILLNKNKDIRYTAARKQILISILDFSGAYSRRVVIFDMPLLLGFDKPSFGVHSKSIRQR